MNIIQANQQYEYYTGNSTLNMHILCLTRMLPTNSTNNPHILTVPNQGIYSSFELCRRHVFRLELENVSAVTHHNSGANHDE